MHTHHSHACAAVPLHDCVHIYARACKCELHLRMNVYVCTCEHACARMSEYVTKCLLEREVDGSGETGGGMQQARSNQHAFLTQMMTG
mmetsp:Transcript_4156/g.8176  ORF Transcript_4156/g.8176 Transcript_4156/m.8176 type:complete len:88 (+) Transcript_4156:228-491(+)